jgi:hypothetical protein
MLVSYTRLEELADFRNALKQDVFLALKILPKVDVLLRDMLASLEKDEISPSVAAKLNELTIVEVEKVLNVLMMLKSNLEHFEEKPEEKKELLNEKNEVEDTQTRITNLMEQLQSLGGRNKLED